MSDSYNTSTSSYTGAPGQILFGILTVVVMVLVAFAMEMLYVLTMNSRNRFQTLVDYTASADDATIVIHQDESKYTDAKPISISMNERTGVEFAYSTYLYVNATTFGGTSNFKHVFHKGYTNAWPLMGPGVFVSDATNTLRVIMNTYANPFAYADILNIPVDKWFHLVLNCYKNGLDIFINGNLANRISFEKTVPYQNFQDIIIFSNSNNNTLNGSTIYSLNDQDFHIQGSMKGHISNLIYARYALSINEIQNLMAAGVSTTIKQKNMDKPPYLGDDWWTHSS
jgi:hypothetical protein